MDIHESTGRVLAVQAAVLALASVLALQLLTPALANPAGPGAQQARDAGHGTIPGQETPALATGDVYTVAVAAGGFAFSPASLTIPSGATVRWIWAGSGHTVTSGSNGVADGLFCSPDDQDCATAPTSLLGAVYEHTFAAPGVFPYFCRPHGAFGMTGEITVQDVALPQPALHMPLIILGAGGSVMLNR